MVWLWYTLGTYFKDMILFSTFFTEKKQDYSSDDDDSDIETRKARKLEMADRTGAGGNTDNGPVTRYFFEEK